MAVRAWLAAALIATAPATVRAQSWALPVYPDATIREWHAEFRDVVHDNYRRMVAPQLNPAETPRLRTLRWDFPADPARVLFDFAARGDGTVFLPVASLLLLKDVVTAEAWLTVNGYASQAVLDYLSVIRMGRLGQWPVRERLPLAALGVPANPNDNPRVLERRNENLSKSVLFIMGHELGHLVHGLGAQAACADPSGGPGPAACDLGALQRSEAAADAFAVELFRRMSVVPSASNFFFAMSSRLHRLPFEFPGDAEWQAYAKGQTHPLDSARIAHVAALIRADRTAFASAPGGAARIDALVDELRRLAQFLNDRNLSGLQVAWGKTLEPQDLKPRRSPMPTLRPANTDLTASAAFAGYFRGELRPQGADDNRQPIEILFRAGSGSTVVGEVMLMGIRGRLDGRVEPPRRALLTLDIAGDLYDTTLETSPDGRTVAGVYLSRLDRSATGRLELTRARTPP
jgi:hypothetical protein